MLRQHSLSIAGLLAIALQAVPVSAQSFPGTDAQLTLTEPAAVEVAESLSMAIDAVTARVRECVAIKASPPQLCFCRSPVEVRRLRAQYEAALVKFPIWKAKVLNWSPLDRKAYRTISMLGLAIQFQQECPK